MTETEFDAIEIARICQEALQRLDPKHSFRLRILLQMIIIECSAAHQFL